MQPVDMIRTSASRPLFFRISTESWRKRLHFSGKMRWMMHEDVIHPAGSRECVDYARQNGYRPAGEHNPPIGQGMSLSWLLNRVKTKYVLNVEDDWHLLEDIDLDLVVSLMDECEDINQIAFFKRPIMSERAGFHKKEVVRNGVVLTTNPYWAFTPAIWRMSYVMPRWKNEKEHVHRRFNRRLRASRRHPNADWVIANTGTYFLGGIERGLFVQHLGMNQSRREETFGMHKQKYPYNHPNLYLGDLFYV